MKKCIFTVALLLTAVFLTSCDTTAQIAGTAEQPYSPSITEQQPNNSKITEHQPYTARGDDGDSITGDISELSFVSDEAILPSSFPVYVVKNPFGQEGPLFDIDEPMIDFMTEKLIRFLRLLYGDSYLSIGNILQYDLEKSHKVRYRSTNRTSIMPDTRISSGVDDISIISKEFGIIDDITNDNLLENALVKAALAFKNIKNPKVTMVTRYDLEGELYEYVYMITDTADDFFADILNSCFSYIRVSYAPRANEVLLIIRDADISEVHSNESVIPFEEAQEYIRTSYDVEDENSINAEIYYSYSVEPGYIVPCYKFYVEDSDADETGDGVRYDVIHIPMASVRK